MNTTTTFLQYNDPIRIMWRSGTIDDPYVHKDGEFQKIINGCIFLDEIPDKIQHVSIEGYVEIYKGIPKSNEFIVNYQNGIIKFNSSEEGKSVLCNYWGRGMILYPASRIYAHNENPDVVTTIQDIIDETELVVQEGKETIERLKDIEESIGTYVHNQIQPSDTWIIEHNLGRYPSVTIVDSGSSMVLGDVQFESSNKIIITFNAEFSGKAFLN